MKTNYMPHYVTFSIVLLFPPSLLQIVSLTRCPQNVLHGQRGTNFQIRRNARKKIILFMFQFLDNRWEDKIQM